MTSTATAQWIATLLIVGLSGALFSTKWQRDWGTPFDPKPREGYPSRAAFIADLELLPEESSAAESLSERGKALYAGYLDSMKALDDKSSNILGLVGAGTGLIALATGSDKVAVHPTPTPLLILSALFLFGVLASTIAVQLPRNRGSINVESLCDIQLLSSVSGKSKLDALIGREYIEASRRAVVVVRTKAIFLSIAQMSFAFGVASLVINALLTASTTHVESKLNETQVRCTLNRALVNCRVRPPKADL